jgi:hypothetical protein
MATETVLGHFLSYLISLAAGLRTEAISSKRQKKLAEKIRKQADELKVISNRQTLAASFSPGHLL